MTRRSLSKKVRFEVFKRDSFACQYCGRTPPVVVLEVDHIIPVASDGCDSEDNLITACFDCNRGKGANDLLDVPESIQARADRIEEIEGQIEGYTKLLASKKRRMDKTVRYVSKAFKDCYDIQLSSRDKSSITRQFLPSLMPDEVEEAADLACSRIDSSSRAWKYFCGICWAKIRNNTNG